MMSRHLSEIELVDLLGDEASPESLAHVARCEGCRGRLGQLRQGLELAREAHVPEPSPIYWQTFRRQVRRGISQAVTPRLRLGFGTYWAVAAATLAIVALLLPAPGPGGGGGADVTWSALPPQGEDVGLQVLSALELDDDLGSVVECGWASCLAELTDEERLAVAEALREELEGRAL
jgi:hypothetical protein